MNASFKNFYSNFYLQTGGFLPSVPLNQNVYPGDFFQIQNGEMVILGNIFRNQILDPALCGFDYGIQLDPALWKFHDGVSRPYVERKTGLDFSEDESGFSKHFIAFENKGHFIFKGNGPESVKLLNWNDIQSQLLIKLTQTNYSFREIYVVTESVACADWTLAIAGADGAEIEIYTDGEGPTVMDVFGHYDSKTLFTKDLAYYHREAKRKPGFFKAKKLNIQDEKLSFFIRELAASKQSKQEWAKGFYPYEFDYDADYFQEVNRYTQSNVLDLLPTHALNPTTALLYFKWVDANLDDIEKLFLPYGN